MPDVPKHGWTHRTKKQGGTDPVPMNLAYADYATSGTTTLSSDETWFLQFEHLSTVWDDIYGIEDADSFPVPAETVPTTKGAAKIVMQGVYMIFTTWNAMSLSSGERFILGTYAKQGAGGTWTQTTEGAPIWNNALTNLPPGAATGYTASGAELIWISVGSTSASNPTWLKPTITLIAGTAPEDAPSFSMRILRIADATHVKSFSST